MKLRFLSIDILRGFAAISVVVYHVIEHLHWQSFPITLPLLWFRMGWMGVDLFFVISGFVIALSAFNGIDLGKAQFRMPFIRHRLARIVPLYYFTALLFVALVAPNLMLGSDLWSEVLSHALFFHNTNWMTHGTIDGPNWSVGTEMQFYLLMLLAAPWLVHGRPWLIGFSMVAISWSWRWFAFRAFPTDAKLGPFLLFVYSSQLPGKLDEFAFGILLARFVRSKAGQQFLSFTADRPWLMPAVAAGMVSFALKTYWLDAQYWDSALMVTFFNSLLGIAWASVVLTACCLRSTIWLRVTAPLRYLGTISYGIYLWHLLVLQSLERLPDLSPLHGLIVTLLLTTILASISWHFFEQPILHRFSNRPDRAA